MAGALVWFAEALSQDQGDSKREKTHRVRLAALLRHYPRPLRVWATRGATKSVFSPNGRYLAILESRGLGMELWNTTTWKVAAALNQRQGMNIFEWGPDSTLMITGSQAGCRQTSERLCRPALARGSPFSGRAT
jgi:hypothetical protein